MCALPISCPPGASTPYRGPKACSGSIRTCCRSNPRKSPRRQGRAADMRPGPALIGVAAAGVAAIASHASAQERSMTASSRAVAMNVTRQNGMVIVSVVGHSAIPRVVRFVIDVDGRSTTRNLARSTVGPDSKTLSVVRFADLPPWQVTLDVDEQGSDHYTLHASDKALQ